MAQQRTGRAEEEITKPSGMLTHPPRQHEWISWLFVALWSLIIFLIVPMARMLQEFVTEHWGDRAFTYIVFATVAIATAAAAFHLRRFKAGTRSSYVWLLAIAAVFFVYAWRLRTHPVEAMHFIEYGLLAILIFRALSHRLRDTGVYIAAAVLVTIVGFIDEAIQWAVPERVWALRDVWLNFFAGFLALLAIAKGLRPKFISAGFGAKSIRYVCRSMMAAMVLLGASMMNTPAATAWYTDRIPVLAWLKSEDVMFEYGYLYEDPEIGTFRSRLPPEELRRADAERGVGAAKILDRYREEARYLEFLDTHPSITNPLMYEARVHLFRRDRYLAEARTFPEGSEEFREALTIAYRENQILEKYFKQTLNHSSYVLPADTIAFMERNLLSDLDYDSAVSRTLATGFAPWHVALGLVGVLLVLVIVERRYGRSREVRRHV